MAICHKYQFGGDLNSSNHQIKTLPKFPTILYVRLSVEIDMHGGKIM